MKLTLFLRCPGTLWIGPDLAILTARTMYQIGATWGWDQYDPFSWLPRLARTPYEIGTVYAASWLGFTLSFARIDVTGREEAARRIMDRTRLVEWE